MSLEALERQARNFIRLFKLTILPNQEFRITAVPQGFKDLMLYHPEVDGWDVFQYTIIPDDVGSPCQWLCVRVGEAPILLRPDLSVGRSRVAYLVIPDGSNEAAPHRKRTRHFLLRWRQRMRLMAMGITELRVKELETHTPIAHYYETYQLARTLRQSVQGGQASAVEHLEQLIQLKGEAPLLRDLLEQYASILDAVPDKYLQQVLIGAHYLLTGPMDDAASPV